MTTENKRPWYVQATPLVAGVARGPALRGAGVAPHAIAVLTQAQLRSLRSTPAGIVVIDAAPLSHDVIRLLALGVPTVLVTSAQASAIPDGAEIIIDGGRGWLGEPAAAVSPGLVSATCSPVTAPVVTRDGVAIALRASVANAAAAEQARACGAAGLGLVRSEFLLAGSTRVPDAAAYRAAFAELCQAAESLPVTVRLLDIAPDKRPAWLSAELGSASPLGLQGVRLYGIEAVRVVVQAQIQALSELAGHSALSVLLPYITHPEEFAALRAELFSGVQAPIAVGAMVETPAAALAIAECLAAADFVALGCNDLMQCLCAADRDRPELSRYLDPYAPAVFRFLKAVAASAGNHLDRVQVCGLLPQVPGLMGVLLGLGFRAFSVEPALLGRLGASIESLDMQAATALAARVVEAHDSAQVRRVLDIGPGSGWALGGASLDP